MGSRMLIGVFFHVRLSHFVEGTCDIVIDFRCEAKRNTLRQQIGDGP